MSHDLARWPRFDICLDHVRCQSIDCKPYMRYVRAAFLLYQMIGPGHPKVTKLVEAHHGSSAAGVGFLV